MKTKVCPCCDQPIKGMYCKGCRKIVWNPVEWEVPYYLNTRHPESEHDCTYHDDAPRTSPEYQVSAGKMTVSETEAKKAEIRERMLHKKQEQQSSAQKKYEQAGSAQWQQKQTRVQKKGHNILTMITFLFLIIFILTFSFFMIGMLGMVGRF